MYFVSTFQMFLLFPDFTWLDQSAQTLPYFCKCVLFLFCLH